MLLVSLLAFLLLRMLFHMLLVSLLAFLLPHMLFHMLLSLAYPLPSSIQINLLMP